MNIYKNVTVEQFKEYFKRDFPFLPLYVETQTYWQDDVVFYNGSFYQSLSDDNTAEPMDVGYWQKIKGNQDEYILDSDIRKAMSQAIINANPRFGGDDEQRVNIYLHLVAFYLVLDLKNSSAGVNSSYVGVTQSKSVGNVSESYAIPQFVMNNPMYAIYAQNGYGLKYLSLISPYLAVTVLFSRGCTTID